MSKRLSRCVILVLTSVWLAAVFLGCESRDRLSESDREKLNEIRSRRAMQSRANLEQQTDLEKQPDQKPAQQESNHQESDASTDENADSNSAQRIKIELGQRRTLGRFDSPVINESSGLAASLRFPGHYWTHNDNGKVGGLFLVDKSGKLKAHVQIADAPFRDWEAIDVCRIDGQSYLTLADVGDNALQYETCRLHVFREPELDLSEVSDEPVRHKVEQKATIEFSYPDGPQDCEAMAVDDDSRTIVLVSKRRTATERLMLHTVPWRLESTSKPTVATRLETDINHSMVTGMDISPDGRLAVLRSYTSMWIYQRDADQGWQQAFATPPAGTLLPLQRQGEAVCFSEDGNSVLLSSEGVGSAIWQIDLELSKVDR